MFLAIVWCWKRPHRSFHETLKSGACSASMLRRAVGALSGRLTDRTERHPWLWSHFLQSGFFLLPKAIESVIKSVISIISAETRAGPLGSGVRIGILSPPISSLLPLA